MKIVTTEKAPAAIGPYSQAVIHDNLVYLSGQIGLDAEGRLVGEGVEEQAAQVLRNVEAVLSAAGSALSKVLKTTIFLTDMNDFAVVNRIYEDAFGDHRPARSTVAAAGLPRAVKVEIEVIAAV